MANPLAFLDRCEAQLDTAKATIAKTRKVAGVVSGVAVAGGFGLLLWKLFGEKPSEPAASPPPQED